MMCGIHAGACVWRMESDNVSATGYLRKPSKRFRPREYRFSSIPASIGALPRRVAGQHFHTERTRPTGHDGTHMSKSYHTYCEPLHILPQ